MGTGPVFTITYWGATGTFPAPLVPRATTDKLVAAISLLVEQGRLSELRPGPGLDAAVCRQVEEGLPLHLRSTYGGNTTCVEVQSPDALVILDCGSGLRELGSALARRWDDPAFTGPRAAHVLLTHAHMDHTWALPHITAFYDPRNQFTIHGPSSVLHGLDMILSQGSPLSEIFFPLTYEQLKGIKDRREVRPGQEFTVGSTHVRTYALHHPGGCLAYRLECAGRSFVFATDHEQQQSPDPGLAEFAHGADLLYTEGQYLQAEYEGRVAIPGEPAQPRQGWGHSPVEACVATAVAAGVRQLHLGHHEPRRNDAQLAQLQDRLQGLMRDALRDAGRPEDSCRAVIPHEGLVVRL
jgi:phosphoribosyl 1,2-cyclic phosphodiesterase